LVDAAPTSFSRERGCVRLLVGAQINRLPVVDSSGVLVGLLTRTDVLKALAAGGGTLPV
jgi:CBS domain-containing protein